MPAWLATALIPSPRESPRRNVRTRPLFITSWPDHIGRGRLSSSCPRQRFTWCDTGWTGDTDVDACVAPGRGRVSMGRETVLADHGDGSRSAIRNHRRCRQPRPARSFLAAWRGWSCAGALGGLFASRRGGLRSLTLLAGCGSGRVRNGSGMDPDLGPTEPEPPGTGRADAARRRPMGIGEEHRRGLWWRRRAGETLAQGRRCAPSSPDKPKRLCAAIDPLAARS